MTFHDALSIMYESENIKMLDEVYETAPDLDLDFYEPDCDDSCFMDLEEA